MSSFHEHPVQVCSWRAYLEFLEELKVPDDWWIFRGHGRCDWPLETSLERRLKSFGMSHDCALSMESILMREFRRQYQRPDRPLVINDDFYCLALMQHHGTPTRLLDFTYSPFVALYFILEYYFDNNPGLACDAAVWCINADWCMKDEKTHRLKNLANKSEREPRFYEFYRSGEKFIAIENPLDLHERLVVQQGCFICPGDISTSTENNVRNMTEWSNGASMRKVRIRLSHDEAARMLEQLRMMNIHRASLFPGLDGFARWLGFRMPIYKRQVDEGWVVLPTGAQSNP